jgi:hypothetical protein
LVAPNVGVTPVTKLLFASFKVIVTVDNAIPSARTGPVPVMVELTATGESAVKITCASGFIKGEVIERVFVSAVKEVNVQVDIPKLFEVEHPL